MSSDLYIKRDVKGGMNCNNRIIKKFFQKQFLLGFSYEKNKSLKYDFRAGEEIQEMIHYYIRQLYEESDERKRKFFEGNIYALSWVLKR